MNNRIKELEPQCWEHNEFGLNFNYQKFAKLIVKECSQISKDYQRIYYESHGARIAKKIKEHFGVEE